MGEPFIGGSNVFSTTDSSVWGVNNSSKKGTPIKDDLFTKGETASLDDSGDYINPQQELREMIASRPEGNEIANGLLQNFFDHLPPAEYSDNVNQKGPLNITASVLFVANSSKKDDALEILETLYQLTKQEEFSTQQLNELYKDVGDRVFTKLMTLRLDCKTFSIKQLGQFAKYLLQNEDVRSSFNENDELFVSIMKDASNTYSQVEASRKIPGKEISIERLLKNTSDLLTGKEDQESLIGINLSPEKTGQEWSIAAKYRAVVVTSMLKDTTDLSDSEIEEKMRLFIKSLYDEAHTQGEISDEEYESFLKMLNDDKLWHQYISDIVQIADQLLQNNPLPATNPDSIKNLEEAVSRTVDDINKSQINGLGTSSSKIIEKNSKEAVKAELERFDQLEALIEQRKEEDKQLEDRRESKLEFLEELEKYVSKAKEELEMIAKVMESGREEDDSMLKSYFETANKIGRRTIFSHGIDDLPELKDLLQQMDGAMRDREALNTAADLALLMKLASDNADISQFASRGGLPELVEVLGR